jgi:serine/threonine-protein kinase
VGGLLACLLAAVVGALLALAKNPTPEPAPAPVNQSSPGSGTGTGTTAASPGLPEIRQAEKIVTPRERELLALIKTRSGKNDDVIQGSIELGLLYVRERRLDDAEKRFKELENETFPGTPTLTRAAGVAGRLGQAVVLAHRDQKATAEQSNELFLKVINETHPKLDKKTDKNHQGIIGFLYRHVELAQAVSDALNRNAAILNKTRLDPPALELLRSPPHPSPPPKK